VPTFTQDRQADRDDRGALSCVPLLGFLTVSGLLLWQAARGLS
jgi:hypothetical protein